MCLLMRLTPCLFIPHCAQISKALLVRKHPLTLTFIERLYDAFGDESIGWEAAKAVGEIVSPDMILTKANHAEIKVCHIITSIQLSS